MKTIFSYTTDIIRLSEDRPYHAVVVLSKLSKSLEAKVILESDISKDEILLGTYHSPTFDYAECYSHVYSLLNDLSYCDEIWQRYIVVKKYTEGYKNESARKKRHKNY